MKIETSNIGFSSQHSSNKQVKTEELLRTWVGDQRPDFEGRRERSGNAAAQMNLVVFSAAGRQAAANAQHSPVDTPASTEIQSSDDPSVTDPKMQLLIRLIESITGLKIKIFDARELQGGNSDHLPLAETAELMPSAPGRPQGWGLEYDRHEMLQESEQTRFSAQGTIKTADGKEVKFDIAVVMEREFTQERNVSIRKGDGVKKDPLVINFSGTAAQLTDMKFSFDLNSDGKAEKISFVTSASGFLALDKNNNGSIDNGSELFGAGSGNGFADLAAYDSDGNHWIDENDAIYSKLLVLSKDASGNNSVTTLIQHKVGALYLGNVATSFDLKNNSNDLQGQVRSTGIYLNEDGSPGTLQQVDLVA